MDKSIASELQDMERLRDRGILTKDEFQAQRAQLLASNSEPTKPMGETKAKAIAYLGVIALLVASGPIFGLETQEGVSTRRSGAAAAMTPLPSVKSANADIGSVEALRAKYAKAIAPCDQASRDVAKVSETEDVQRMYEQAHRAEGLCRASSDSVMALRGATSALGLQQVGFNALINRCANAYRRAGIGYGKMAAVLDRDRRALAKWLVAEEMIVAADDLTGCTTELSDALSRAGAKMR